MTELLERLVSVDTKLVVFVGETEDLFRLVGCASAYGYDGEFQFLVASLTDIYITFTGKKILV